MVYHSYIHYKSWVITFYDWFIQHRPGGQGKVRQRHDERAALVLVILWSRLKTHQHICI